MTPLNFRPIYDRHQGPYTLLLLRLNHKGEQFSDRVTGSSLRAQAAHEKAVDLINDRDPVKTDVDSVYVFSDTEGQFTGALYRRGEEYTGWEHLPIDDEPSMAKRVYGGDVAEAIAPPPKAPRIKTPGFPAMRGKALTMNRDPDAKWPASPPAQVVKQHFERQGPDYSATVPELVASIGAALALIGVAFPASLISRLKQAGLLRQDAPRASTTTEDNA